MDEPSPSISRLDALARELAGGRISRRGALGRLIGGAAVVVLPSALAPQAAMARCPPSRKCGHKCCPPGARCKHGKCKCKKGRKKCGHECVDVSTDPKNCGSCGHACGPGESCSGGVCRGGGSGQVCGNGVAEGTEICDGADLKGATCQSLGFLGGTLVCTGSCTYDTSGCTSPACSTAADCPQGPAGDCQMATCVSGTCGFAADDTDNPADANQCSTGVCVGGVPGQSSKPSGTSCSTGKCDGSGTCVPECSVASDCPGSDTLCGHRTCTSGHCGTAYEPNGTYAGCVTSSPNQQAYCDGSGGITTTSGTCPVGQMCYSYTTPQMFGGTEVGKCA